jgi:hypothetical protein
MKHVKHTLPDILTFEQVLAIINERRPCSRSTLVRHMRKLGVMPVGKIRTCPLYYEADVPAKILEAVSGRIVTMPQLRAVKRQSRRAA